MNDGSIMYELNIGGSNKAATLDVDRIVAGAVETTDKPPVVLALTEVSNLKVLKKLIAELAHKTEGTEYNALYAEFSKGDRTALVYDAARIRPGEHPTEVSLAGKFMALELVDTTDGTSGVVTVVHLPHKVGKQLAYNTLNQFMIEKPRNLVLGDFNMWPSEIQYKLPNCHERAIKLNEIVTTDKARSKDNFAVTPQLQGTFINTQVLATVGSDHYPIITEWCINPHDI